jgi:hypothetical protein
MYNNVTTGCHRQPVELLAKCPPSNNRRVEQAALRRSVRLSIGNILKDSTDKVSKRKSHFGHYGNSVNLQSQSLFFRLPLELRQLIYLYVIQSWSRKVHIIPKGTHLSHIRCRVTSNLETDIYGPILGCAECLVPYIGSWALDPNHKLEQWGLGLIGRTCKAINSEFMPLLYAKTTFIFPTRQTLRDFVKTTPQAYREAVRTVRLEAWVIRNGLPDLRGLDNRASSRDYRLLKVFDRFEESCDEVVGVISLFTGLQELQLRLDTVIAGGTLKALRRHEEMSSQMMNGFGLNRLGDKVRLRICMKSDNPATIERVRWQIKKIDMDTLLEEESKEFYKEDWR